MIFNLMKPVPIAEPTMYSYNGTVLPALPEWDKETYPYAVIKYSEIDTLVVSGYYASLYLCKNPITVYYQTYGSYKVMKIKQPESPLLYGMVSNDQMLESVNSGVSAYLGSFAHLSAPNQWEVITDYSGEGLTIPSTLWANHDIVNTDNDNEVILSASDPVPVYE